MVRGLFCIALALLAAPAPAAEFGAPGGPEPANIDEIVDVLRKDAYDLELFVSFGTSKGGSAGHLALGVRDALADDDLVYSANFYADRSEKHATGFYTENLMAAIPRKEYLFRTASSLGDVASFGLDFGEIYKRSVLGIRVFGVPSGDKQALVDFFKRINDDYHQRARNTAYHDREIKYDYLRLNCAKTIGSAFRYGAGYTTLEIFSPLVLPGRPVAAAVNANIPTEMALKLMKEWNARGYAMDVVLYRKYPGSTYVDPREEEKVMFKDLPDRFPSVLSRDFRREQGRYEDPDNLYAMYLLYNLGRYGIRMNEETKRLAIEFEKSPLPYERAAALAAEAAASDSANFGRGANFTPKGTRVGEEGGTIRP
ncbi:MAG TPA: hypothetical protein VFX81_08175 [Burkholderiaceae bacterium]|nr:hypothetical protein [Burkholderiaceae bacterium]